MEADVFDYIELCNQKVYQMNADLWGTENYHIEIDVLWFVILVK